MATHLAPWEAHGPLRVSECGHHLVHEDGTGFFWLGCTPWMLVGQPPDAVDRFLDIRQRQGFDVYQVNISNWLRGDDQGHMPFLGEGGRPYANVLPNAYYWSYVDSVLDKLAQRGLYMAMVLMWRHGAYRAERRFFADPVQGNYAYARWVAERYAGRPNVIWVACGEYGRPEELTDEALASVHSLIRGIDDGRGPHQLMTIHPNSPFSSSQHWAHEPALDFDMIQTFGKTAAAYSDMVYADYSRVPHRPVLNAEPGYEDRHLYMPDRGKMDAWHLRMEGYVSLFSGGFGYTYGHATMYHFGAKEAEGTGWEQWIERPGAEQMIHMRNLMTTFPLATRVPDPDLVHDLAGPPPSSQNHIVGTRDRDGSWAMVYSSMGHPFTVDMGHLQSGQTWRARWFDPRSGVYWPTTLTSYGNTGRFVPPSATGRGHDWILVLDSP